MSAPLQEMIAAALRHARAGEFSQAEALYRQILSIDLNPNFCGALGNVLQAQGKSVEAEAAYRRGIQLNPSDPRLHNNLGNLLAIQRKFREAIDAYRKALSLKGDYTEASTNLDGALSELARLEQANAQGASFQGSDAKRDSLETRLNQGNALSDLGRTDEAIAEFQNAIKAFPQSAGPHNNLGIDYLNMCRIGEAIESFGKAIELEPHVAEIHGNLANALSRQGRLDESIVAYRRALQLKPDYVAAFSNLLLSMHYDDRVTPQKMFQTHLDWAARFEAPLIASQRPHANAREPERRLRIGYVSADLGTHPVGRFMKPLLENHDRHRFEIFAYASNSTTDNVTQQLQPLVDRWRNPAGMTDETLAEIIREDSIDILIDLSGHTAAHRLLVFARKPAPIQVTYLGYPDTTGLRSIDYRIVDAVSDPPMVGDDRHTEKLWRLDGPFLCYQPPNPKIAPPPSVTSGMITFGSFNNLSKISPRALRLWAEIIRAVPGSRLQIKAMALTDEPTRALLESAVLEMGLSADRVDITPPATTFDDHLSGYDSIDIALDTFPYNGTTTTCEALARGVPVIALAGNTHASRTGISLLTHAGLPEFVAADEASYVRIAVELANYPDRLRDLRGIVAQRFVQSPLGDGARLARSIEAAFREMWKDYCKEL